MLMLTVKKEWMQSLREGRFRWLASIVMVLLMSALVASWDHYQVLAEQKSQVSAAERARWLAQGSKDPHSAAHYGVYVIKPDMALAMLEPGLSMYQGEVLRLEAHKQNDSLFRRIQDAIPLQRFGDLTPAFIVQMLLPLLIILSGFHLISSERESGTLKQLLASGVKPNTLIFAKAFSLCSIAAVMLLPVFIFVLFSQLNHAEEANRSMLFIAAYIAYSVIWALLTLGVSIYSSCSRRALVSLLVIWVLVCLLIPKWIMAQAQHQYPLTSNRDFQAQLESVVYTPQRLKAIAAFKQQTLAKYQVDTVDELPISWSGAQLQFAEEYADKMRDDLFIQREQQLLNQARFYQQGALLSPFIALQSLSMASAATDHVHHQLFITAAEAYRRDMQKTLNQDLMYNGKRSEQAYRADRALWQSIAEFDFTYPNISQLLSHYQAALLSLLLWCGLLLLFTVLMIKKLTQEQLR